MQTLTSPPTLSNVSSSRGAPMGRRNCLPQDPSAPIALLVERLEWQDGDYDRGGAYWGGGSKDWIWRATGEDAEEQVEIFTRAKCYQSATDAFAQLVPGATFTASTAIDLEAFVEAYIVAALWSSTGDDDSPLDDDYGPEDIAPPTLVQMQSNCATFVECNAADLALCGLSSAQCGHDFWLTRNRHGAGFWDRDGDADALSRLSDASRSCGGVDLYVADGQIHA